MSKFHKYSGVGVFYCIFFVLVLTQKPFDYSINHLIENEGLLKAFFLSFFPIDFVLNILFFLPPGFLLMVHFQRKEMTETEAFIKVIYTGLVLSIFVETGQLFLNRSTTLTDIVANGIGTFVGAKLYFSDRFNQKSWCDWIAVLAMIAIFIMILVPVYFMDFSNWDDSYHLYIGNEATGDRAWKGCIKSVQIYNDVPADELNMENLFEELPRHLSQKSCLINLIFNGSADRHSAALHSDQLHFVTMTDHISNTNVNGYTLDGSNALVSAEPITEHIRKLKNTSKMTIVLEIIPAHGEQTGPARIISLSHDTNNRNFTLGQEGRQLSLRVRTPLNGLNGSNFELMTSALMDEMTHTMRIVVICSRKQMKIYVNDSLVARTNLLFEQFLPAYLGFGTESTGLILYYGLILMTLFLIVKLYFNLNVPHSLLLSISPLLVKYMVLLLCRFATV